LHDRHINEMSKIVTKQKDLNFDRSKTLRKSAISFNFRIIDGHIEIPHCMLLFDKHALMIILYLMWEPRI
jgi:hypothetical protein